CPSIFPEGQLTLERGFSSLNLHLQLLSFALLVSIRRGTCNGQQERFVYFSPEFARRAAFASAAASLVPAELLNSQTAPAPLPAQQPPNSPNLSPESQAEVESRIQAICAQYGK